MFSKLLCNAKSTKEKEQLKELIAVSQPLIDAWIRLIEKDIENYDVVDEKDFDCPSWAVKTAYKQGVKKGLTKLREYVII